MNGLALKIGDQWARLSRGTSITITEKSSVFDDGNAFSIPFQLNAEMNRHLLGNATEVSGVSFYEAIDRKPAVLYVQGIPMFHGVVRLDSEEATLEDGCIDINLESGNLTLDDLIADMNCRDVPLKDKIVLGEKLDDRYIYPTEKGKQWPGYDNAGSIKSYYPSSYQRMEVDGVSTVNYTNPYPISPYCNIRICYKMPDENGEGKDYTDLDAGDKYWLEYYMNMLTYGGYLSLPENRPMSSPCFYVLYFLDCLFKHLKLSYTESISYMEDMNRLAFVNMAFEHDQEFTGKYITEFGNVLVNNSINGFAHYIGKLVGDSKFVFRYRDPIYYCIANSKNFPDTDVSEVIDALKSGFGIRFIVGNDCSSVRAVYVRDILRNKDSYTLPAVVHSVQKTDLNVRGFRLTYNGGEDDTAYNYNDYANAVKTTAYNQIVSEVSVNNKSTYIDLRNGNAYRVKIDSDAKSSKEANPALFEVGAFGDATYGDCGDEELVETVEIGFQPVVMNDIGWGSRKDRMNQSRRQSPVDISTSGSAGRTYSDDTNNEQTFAFFLDITMMYPSFPTLIDNVEWIALSNRGAAEGGVKYTQLELQRFDESYSETSHDVNVVVRARGTAQGQRTISTTGTRRTNQVADRFENKSPIHSYDCGLTLGIMRGPGNEAGVEDIEENYDEEGNYKYVATGKKPAFHSDICDNYNRLFDYNGTEQGGVDVSGRFSLKLRAEKPDPEGGFFPITDVNMQKRGLFDKFYAEYAYFVTHRKLVKMKLRMELADLLQIDWTKRYRIGNYTGFINKYEYTVTDEGVGEISLDMYVV